MTRSAVGILSAIAAVFFAAAAGEQFFLYPEASLGMRCVYAATVLLYGFVGVTSFLSRPDDRRVRVFFTACVAIVGTWAFYAFPPVVPSTLVEALYVPLHAGIFFLTSALLLHIAALLPEESPLVRRHPEIIRSAYEITGLLVGAVAFAYVNARFGWIEGLPATAESLEPLVRTIVLGFYGIATLGGSLLILQAGVHSSSVASRRQAIALFAVLFPFGSLRLIAAIYPPLMSVPVYPVLETMALLLIPLGLFLAVQGFHLFELRVHLRRGVLLALTGVVVVCAGYAVVVTAGLILPAASLWGVVLLCLAAGAVLHPFLRSIGVFVDTIFFPERLMVRRLTGELLERVAEFTDVRVLSAVLAKAVVESLAVAKAGVYVVGGDDSFFELAGSAGDADGIQDRISCGEVKLAIAGASGGAGNPWNEWTSLFPINFRERLNAILVVGAKRSGEALSRDEIREVAAASLQIAAMIENARLFALATRDSLTGLLRRPVFDEQLETETARFGRGGSVFAVLMADIDNFKRVNDTFGHPMGDRVLRAVSTAIRSHTRESDIVSRYGGEEIILLLPNTDSEGALAIAEKLRAAVAGVAVAEGELILRATVSVGVAVIEPEMTPSRLVALADEALYQAKNLGKNRVEIAVESRRSAASTG
jgi:diguanylate cyclase (GGDEF)-like protein